MRKELLTIAAALLVSAGNIAYASTAAAFAVCTDYTCNSNKNCEDLTTIECNVCSPFPFSGNKCLLWSED